MFKFIKKLTVSIIYFSILIILGLFIFPAWSLMIAVWTGLYFLIKYREDDKILSIDYQHKIWISIVFGYPIIETFIKAMLVFNIIPFSCRPLNIAEHFLWALCMYLMLLPYVKKLNLKLENFWTFILIAGIVIIFGNLNELLEFLIRNYYGLTSQAKYAAYYLDTTIDLVVNIFGVMISGFLSYKYIVQPSSTRL